MTVENPLILVDGSSFLFRAYYAMPELTNAAGQATGAILGTLNMLRKLLDYWQTDSVLVIFDSKGPTFRHQLYADYKANRSAMPEALAEQIEPLQSILRNMGIPLLAQAGVEADDLIGTVAKQAHAVGRHVVIASHDKDMAQLVNERVVLFHAGTDQVIDANGVVDKWGVHPGQMVDYLALVGDKVDNVPGISGVGPKTAVKWLAQYGCGEGLMQHADEVKGKVGERLRAEQAAWQLSRDLVTICCDCDVGLSIEDCVIGQRDIPALIGQFEQLQFKQWLHDVRQQATASQGEAVSDQVIIEHNALEQIPLSDCDDKRPTCYLRWVYADAQLRAVFCTMGGHQPAYCVYFSEDAGDALQQLAQWLTQCQQQGVRLVGWQLKPLLHSACRAQVTIPPMDDLQLMSYVFKGLDGLSSLMELLTVWGVAVQPAGRVQFADVAQWIDELNALVALDGAMQQAEIADSQWQVYRQIERPFQRVLVSMEHNGVLIDSQQLTEQSVELAGQMRQLAEQIYSASGCEFNIDSPKQLGAVLFEQLGLPVLKKTPKGLPSTQEEVMQALAVEHDIAQWVMDYRHAAKLKSTYTDKLPQMVNSATGRIHTEFVQTGTATGRLASREPNLQNIPIRTQAGAQIRQAFIARPGYVVLSADYSQIELRLMAHLSEDSRLLEAFMHNQDVHAQTASVIEQIDVASVSEASRRRAKAINFGLIYGMSEFGLAKQLGVSRQVAAQWIETYFAQYPGVYAFMERVKALAAEQGYVETLTQRRLWMPQIHAKQARIRMAAERAAINAPLQGSAADLIKLAMIELLPAIERQGLPAELILQVHDELVFEVSAQAASELGVLVRTTMESAMKLRVPLQVSLGSGAHWQAAH